MNISMDTEQNTKTRKLKSFGGLVVLAISLYKKNPNVFALISVIPLLFAWSLSLIHPSSIEGVTSFVVVVGISALLLFCTIIMAITYPIALTEGMVGAEKGEHIDAGSLFDRAFKKLGVYLIVSILVALVMFGAFSLFILPAIVAGVYLSFVLYTTVLEGKKGYDALIQSIWYVKDYFWAVFGRTVLLLLCIMAIAMGLAALAALFGELFNTGSGVLNFVSDLLMGMFVTPVFLSFYYVLYKDIRDAKQGIVIDQKKAAVLKKWFVVLSVVAFLVPVVIISTWGLGSIVGTFGF
jgi:hypothetical protein